MAVSAAPLSQGILTMLPGRACELPGLLLVVARADGAGPQVAAVDGRADLRLPPPTAHRDHPRALGQRRVEPPLVVRVHAHPELSSVVAVVANVVAAVVRHPRGIHQGGGVDGVFQPVLARQRLRCGDCGEDRSGRRLLREVLGRGGELGEAASDGLLGHAAGTRRIAHAGDGLHRRTECECECGGGSASADLSNTSRRRVG
eukprot:scaffold102824_cov60-Phaeocystis_antarctica.AAC.2